MKTLFKSKGSLPALVLVLCVAALSYLTLTSSTERNNVVGSIDGYEITEDAFGNNYVALESEAAPVPLLTTTWHNNYNRDLSDTTAAFTRYIPAVMWTDGTTYLELFANETSGSTSAVITIKGYYDIDIANSLQGTTIYTGTSTADLDTTFTVTADYSRYTITTSSTGGTGEWNVDLNTKFVPTN